MKIKRIIVSYYLVTSALMIRSGLAMLTIHFKCRNGLYPRSNVERFFVPDDKVPWSVEYDGYRPPSYTSAAINGQTWADPEIGEPGFNPIWNHRDGNVNRESYMGSYMILKELPLNPIGRTGIYGRGVLGRWGPNHAADPVVTRWKRINETGAIEFDANNRPVLQFVAVKRRDTGEWALPGGMVDPGEKVSATAVREFQEEATNSLEMPEAEKQLWQQKFNKFFAEGDIVYKGYVDDPRNTDTAWMETIAYNFHDETGNTVGKLKLNAGDDAMGVCWLDISSNLNLYASHRDIVLKVLTKRLATQENST